MTAWPASCSKAYVDRLREAILNACGRLGEKELQRRLLELLVCNSFPMIW